jgi:hypothetical protein
MNGSDADALVISSYPLTDRYRAALQTKVEGGMEFVTAGKLRANGTKELLRRQLASRYRRVIVASESADAGSFVPLIALVALGFRWPRVDLVDPEKPGQQGPAAPPAIRCGPGTKRPPRRICGINELLQRDKDKKNNDDNDNDNDGDEDMDMRGRQTQQPTRQ